LTLTLCPTPIGLGATLQKAYVGHDNGGSCALATGKTISEVAIANIRNKAIEIAIFLLNENVTSFFSYFLLEQYRTLDVGFLSLCRKYHRLTKKQKRAKILMVKSFLYDGTWKGDNVNS
jgi:uncharacterized membrane protein